MIKLLDILKEIVTATQIICDDCGWKWDIADGGDDLYICHNVITTIHPNYLNS